MGSLTFFGMFAVGFVSAIGQAYVNTPYPPSLLVVQHSFTLLCSAVFFVSAPIQMYYYPTNGYNFSILGETCFLVSLYPVLDTLNMLVLWKAHYGKREFDWDAHRGDNLIGFVVLASAVVMCLGSRQKHYFFDKQLSAMARIGFESIPILIWVATWRPITWAQRVYNLMKAP